MGQVLHEGFELVSWKASGLAQRLMIAAYIMARQDTCFLIKKYGVQPFFPARISQFAFYCVASQKNKSSHRSRPAVPAERTSGRMPAEDSPIYL
ncbi:hypothetical protein ACIPEN_00445 [Herbaspirillum chlorophenolicum]|uniref:Uncharacterized protein n=1 Tax=Herbaspirillum chlorophenolicum TaxID=211589 RepID=A0ABW8EW03_9BURK